jgi:hypothetical protein
MATGTKVKASIIARIDPSASQWLNEELFKYYSITSFILPLKIDENGFVLNRDQLHPCGSQSVHDYSFIIEFNFQRQPIPSALDALVMGIRPYVQHLTLLSIDHRPLFILRINSKQTSCFSLYRFRRIVKMLWPECNDPIFLSSSAQEFCSEGTIENSIGSLRCREDAGKLDYDSYRYHSHFRPFPASPYYIPSCHAVRQDNHDLYVNYSNDSYLDWIRVSLTWAYLYHYPSGFAAVHIEDLEAHSELLVNETFAYEKPHLTCEASNVIMPDAEKGSTRSSNTAIVIHAFYPENLAAIFKLIEPSSDVVDYLISTTEDKASAVISCLEDYNIKTYKLFITKNHGRDVVPFINVLLPALVHYNYDHFIKIHTKKSPHLDDGADWGTHLISSLISQESIRYIRRTFGKHNRTGLLSPPGSIIPITACLSMNALWLAELLAAYGISPKWAIKQDFIAGSMFAGRVSLLSSLTTKSPSLNCYESELGQVDATLAHAMERFLSVFVQHQNFDLVEVPGNPNLAPAFGYQDSKPTSDSGKTLAQILQINKKSIPSINS